MRILFKFSYLIIFAECDIGNSDVSLCFDECGNDQSNGLTRGRSLYFFARSAREKERWFHR